MVDMIGVTQPLANTAHDKVTLLLPISCGGTGILRAMQCRLFVCQRQMPTPSVVGTQTSSGSSVSTTCGHRTSSATAVSAKTQRQSGWGRTPLSPRGSCMRTAEPGPHRSTGPTPSWSATLSGRRTFGFAPRKPDWAARLTDMDDAVRRCQAGHSLPAGCIVGTARDQELGFVRSASSRAIRALASHSLVPFLVSVLTKVTLLPAAKETVPRPAGSVLSLALF
jgi:hypothetical protein